MAVEKRKKAADNADHKEHNEEKLNAARAKKFGTRPGLVAFASLGAVGILCVLFHIGVVTFSQPKFSLFLRSFSVLESPEFHQKDHIAKFTWGTYRPHVYFGMSTKSPESPLVGLMYHTDQSGMPHIRHKCNHDDVTKFGWERHDGSTFGQQMLHDREGFTLRTEFLKHYLDGRGGAWTARVSGKWETDTKQKPAAIIVYHVDQSNSDVQFKNTGETGRRLEASGPVIGRYAIEIPAGQSGVKGVHHWATHTSHIHNLTEKVSAALSSGKAVGGVETHVLPDTVEEMREGVRRFTAIQLLVEFPFTVDIIYTPLNEDGSAVVRGVVGDDFTAAVEGKVAEFEERLGTAMGITREKVAKDVVEELGEKDDSLAEERYRFAQTALSSMIGSIGYFYGVTRIVGHGSEHRMYTTKAAPLLCAVPSRTDMPYGRHAEDGYHTLMLKRWDLRMSKEVIAHWLDHINAEGWLDPNLVLGEEAMALVPKDADIAFDLDSAPPTFLYVLNDFAQELSNNPNASDEAVFFTQRLFFRLKIWVEWYAATQQSPVPGLFMWSDRNPHYLRASRPKSLPTGLPAYPRAAFITGQEGNVDLRSWMTMGLNMMSMLTSALGAPYEPLAAIANTVADNEQLAKRCWSKERQQCFDFGGIGPNGELGLVAHFGYVSLFPMLVEQLDSDNYMLEKTMEHLRNPNLLWTDFGLRSLSKDSSFYLQPMGEKGDTVWNGPVYLDINYLALRALYRYGNKPGPYAKQARVTYKELRANIIRNVFQQYKETGYLWEYYDVAPGNEGRGRGMHPYNGGSSLMAMIIGEQY